jgi:hypothetical protein
MLGGVHDRFETSANNYLILIARNFRPSPDARRPATDRLRLEGRTAAAWMVALARKLCKILGVLAGLAAVLLMIRGNTTTGGVGTLFGFAHSASP